VNRIRKPSAWTFDTSEGQSGGYGVFTGTHGNLYLISPEGEHYSFEYRAVGGSFSQGSPFNLTESTTSSWSAGSIFVLESCPGFDLKVNDFEGTCICVNFTAGAGLGISGDYMLLGSSDAGADIAKVLLQTGAFTGVLSTISWRDAFDFVAPLPALLVDGDGPHNDKPILDLQISAKALLVSPSFNAGYQLQIGASLTIGWVSAKRIPQPVPPPPPPPIPIKRSPTEIHFHLKSEVLFEFGKDRIKPGAETYLKLAGNIVKNTSHLKSVLLTGHTDSIGTKIYNLCLSERRAAKVADWMADNGYAKRQQIGFVGAGDSQPVASNRTKEGRAKNRRVEVLMFTSM
jgi:outer membrane protein OmpA-like peptidoglycan-associated protein